MFVTLNDYLELPRDPIPYLIKDLIPTEGFVNFYGKPKAGKSFGAIGMAMAVVNGDPDWNGFEVLKSGPVAYVQMDTPRGEWATRMVEFKKKLATMNTKHPFYLMDMLLTAHYPFDILSPEHFNYLKNAIDALPERPVLVILDTLREFHMANENDATEMRNVIGKITATARGCAIMVLSHARKESMKSMVGGDDIMDDVRGSSYLAGRVDSQIRLTKSVMSYQGRGAGSGSIAIEKDPDTGWILRKLDNKELDLIVTEVIAGAEEGTSKKEIGRRIAARFKEKTGQSCSMRTGERHYEKYLERLR